MLTPFVATLGAAAFLFAALYIIEDRRRAERAIECTSIFFFHLKLFSKEFFHSNESIK
jgi:hypothetical protein